MDTTERVARKPAGSGPLPPAGQSRTTVAMDTLVSVHVVSASPIAEVDDAMARALAWFARVERACSRFDQDSELVRLCRRPGEAVPVSGLLFEVVAFAIETADLTGGAFDPTVGGAQQARGFTRNYITGDDVTTGVSPASYRHVRLDRKKRTIALRRPLLLDLGAVAKGFAIDLAARELAGFERFAVEAGGDLYAGGTDAAAPPWRVGVRHPERDALLGTLSLHSGAVCTSGGSERPAAGEGEHHLLDPRTGRSPRAVTGVTVVAPTAMVADALATAAFVLGPKAGARLLEDQGVAGIIVTATDRIRVIPGRIGGLSWSASQQQEP